uniref:Lipase-like C-terminal domain-containing protein n=2 Tax=Globisporangium ultimum (strain ATCC 200006 / CBS 805.95 / DAOM BR144) TaxID=431595 RepID=K3WFI1_GLOUD
MMHKLLSTLLFIVLAPVLVFAQNKYPIVLVHGFSGWGRDELLGLKYWGGIQGDLQEQLKAQGYTVYTASVGPFSSNWDRAVELYAQIKGGRADYGAKHSTTHGHTRMGRTYPGLYPEWGNVVNGKVNKIHLIGHSMGGQTVRMLAQLLAKGSAGSPTGTEDPTSNSLFAGGKDWIHSITTISTPNQGTTLANGFSEIGDAVKDLLAGVFSVLNVGGSTTEMIYDAKLDQWGLSAKQSGESLGDYIKRIFKSPIFNPGFKDVCLWSLSTQGATEESTWVQTLSNIYYYSYATVDTHAGVDLLLRTIQRPNLLTMLLPLQPLGTFIGGRYAPNNGFATSWQANDGVVPLTSQSKDSKGSLVVFGGSSQIGKWNQMPQLDRMDHLAVVGITLHTQIKDMYVAHAQLLASLPAASITSSVSTLTTTESTTTAISEAATLSVIAAAAALKNAAASVNTKADLEKLCASPINTYAKNYCTNMLNNANATTRRLRG